MCANRLLPSLMIKAAAVKILNSVMKTFKEDQSQPRDMDPLFSPAPTLHTKDTEGTDKTHEAFDVNYFFSDLQVEGVRK